MKLPTIALEELIARSTLRQLKLKTRIDDEQAELIAQMRSLYELYMPDCQVSPWGIESLFLGPTSLALCSLYFPARSQYPDATERFKRWHLEGMFGNLSNLFHMVLPGRLLTQDQIESMRQDMHAFNQCEVWTGY